MVLNAIRSAAIVAAGLVALASPGFAQDNAQAPSAAPSRLALVIGEAAYVGAPLPTAAADATLVAKTLAAQGFDVTELHDLNTPDLAAAEQAFVAKAKAAPAGATVVAYFGGLGVTVGCDDFLLPVDAHIAAQGDVPRIALSMTKTMADLADTPSQARVVLLDGARPIPPSVSAVQFPKGLIALAPPAATSFGLAAEIHDFEAPPKPGDANDAYVQGLAAALQQPFGDIDTLLRETRLAVHQATMGAQTPWHASDPSTPPFTFPLEASDAAAQAASSALPDPSNPIGSLQPEAAYWAAIWRNTIDDYKAFLDAFASSAPAERVASVRTLLALLQEPNPNCGAPALIEPRAPAPAMAAPICPDGFLPTARENVDFCAPIEVRSPCPAGTLAVVIGGAPVCRIVSTCPPGLHPIWTPRGWTCAPPPYCPPGVRTVWSGNGWLCQRPPVCRQGDLPVWGPRGWICQPPRVCPPDSRPVWTPNGWACAPPRCWPGRPGCAPPPNCRPGQPGCPPPPPPNCAPWRPGCPPPPPPPNCRIGQPGCLPPPLKCIPWRPGCPAPPPPPPKCRIGQPGCLPPPLNCAPWRPGCPTPPDTNKPPRVFNPPPKVDNAPKVETRRPPRLENPPPRVQNPPPRVGPASNGTVGQPAQGQKLQKPVRKLPACGGPGQPVC